MRYKDAIRLPFTNWHMLLMALLLPIPFLNFYAYGYILNVARQNSTTYAGLPALPGFLHAWIDGLVVFAISVVYAIPSVVLLYATTAFDNSAIQLIISLLAILSLIAYLYLVPAVLGTYSTYRHFNGAFDLPVIFRSMFTRTYLKAWAVALIWGYVVAFFARALTVFTEPTVILPLYIAGIGLFVILTTAISLSAQALAENT